MADRDDSGRDGGAPPAVEPAVAGEAVTQTVEAATEALDRVAAALPQREHLLAGYDRARQRVLTAVERRGGKLGADVVRVLLLVPDIFLLLVRLALDREVPAGARTLIASALAYFVLPIDLVPEALLGGAGYLDDVVLATAVLTQAFGGELEPYARRHWSGPEDLRVVLRDISAATSRLLGPKTQARLEKLIPKKDRPTADEGAEP